MVAQILDGTATAKLIKNELAERISVLHDQGYTPGLATILVGEDPGSQWYVNGKHRDCAEVGINSIRYELPEDVSAEELAAVIDEVNQDDACTGYILQLPLPKHLDTNTFLEMIDPAKDADGLHPMNLGRLLLNINDLIDTPLPCTPRGVIELVERHGMSWEGKNVVVIGRGVTVGRSLGPLLTRREYNATVTLTHTGTQNLAEITKQADVIVSAAGSARIVTKDMVKPGAVVLDVGVSREVDSLSGKKKVIGDIDPAVQEVASWFSPNPGGVGPMTRALLLKNVVETAERIVQNRS